MTKQNFENATQPRENSERKNMLQEADVYKMLVSGEQWGKWQGFQFPMSEQYVTIWTPIGTEMHWKPGTWIAGKHSLAYFWPNTWQIIHANYYEDGRFAGCYCDLVLPTPSYTSASRELAYVDLYLDVVVRDDHSVYTKDHEVFERAAQRYPAVEEARSKVFEAMNQLEEQANNWTGPFAIIPARLLRTDWQALSAAELHAAISSLR